MYSTCERILTSRLASLNQVMRPSCRPGRCIGRREPQRGKKISMNQLPQSGPTSAVLPAGGGSDGRTGGRTDGQWEEPTAHEKGINVMVSGTFLTHSISFSLSLNTAWQRRVVCHGRHTQWAFSLTQSEGSHKAEVTLRKYSNSPRGLDLTQKRGSGTLKAGP